MRRAGGARKQREIAYLGLTRFMRTLEDRLDRLAMRAGVETRVPFCDHRLVQYLYNVPWPMHTADGQERNRVVKVSRVNFPESDFETPADYTQKPLPMMGAGAHH